MGAYVMRGFFHFFMLAASFLALLSFPAHADHAIAMHGTPRYAEDFSHLDYVNPDAPKGGHLRLAKQGSFDNLNNHIITGNNAEGLEHVNDKLMVRAWNEPFTMYGLVAEKVDVAEDRSWITFHLNPAARFHDGQQMTPYDVQYSFDFYRKNGHPVRRRVYGLVTEIEIVGKHSIKFTFGEGYDRESVLILAMMPVLPKHYWEKRDLSKTTLEPPLGSGPYKITEVEPGRKIAYERVKDWWAKDLPINRGLYNFDKITYNYFRDDDISLQAFKSGAYDIRRENDLTKWLGQYDFPDLTAGKVVKEEVAHGRPEWLRAFIFNTRRPLFADIRIREAVGLMFNEEWINRNFFGGAKRRINSIFPNSELAATPTETGSAESLDMRARQRKAMALLKEAGWIYNDQQKLVHQKDGQVFSFELLLSDPSEEKIALEFTRSLEKLGIDARVRTVDSAQFSGRLEGFDFDMVSYRWINSLSPGNEQVNYWGKISADSKGARNYAGIKDDEIDRLADAIARTDTREELVARCHALDRAVMAGHYFVPLFYLGRDLLAYRQGIRRPETTPVYGIVLESFWSEQAQNAP